MKLSLHLKFFSFLHLDRSSLFTSWSGRGMWVYKYTADMGLDFEIPPFRLPPCKIFKPSHLNYLGFYNTPPPVGTSKNPRKKMAPPDVLYLKNTSREPLEVSSDPMLSHNPLNSSCSCSYVAIGLKENRSENVKSRFLSFVGLSVTFKLLICYHRITDEYAVKK